MFTCLLQLLCCGYGSFIQPWRKRLQLLRGWTQRPHSAPSLHCLPELGIHIRQPDTPGGKVTRQHQNQECCGVQGEPFLNCTFFYFLSISRKCSRSWMFSSTSNVLSHLDIWWKGRSSLWCSVDPQQVWTVTFICAQTSFTFFSTFSSSEVTWGCEQMKGKHCRNHQDVK